MSKLSPLVLDVLRAATCEGRGVRLPHVHLERSTYEGVNEVLECLGGKWKRRGKPKEGIPQGTHEFPYDPAPLLEAVLETGEQPPKNPTAFFPTPAPIVAKMVEWADLPCKNNEFCRIIEPSAGTGAIADAIRASAPLAALDLVEVLPINASMLRHKGYAPHEGDFLQWKPEYRYDAVLMNPPFSLGGNPLAYITHILHAWDLLRDGGDLVAITPTGFTHRSDRKSRDFLAMVGEHGEWTDIEAGAFKESGTGIATRIVWMRKIDQSWKAQAWAGWPSWHCWAANLWRDNEREHHDARTRMFEQIRAGTLTNPEKAIRSHYEDAVLTANQHGEGVRPSEADFAHLAADFLAEYEEWAQWQDEASAPTGAPPIPLPVRSPPVMQLDLFGSEAA